MSKNQDFTFVLPDGSREAAARRTNPDGTIGGWVAASARVHSSAVVEPDAVVGPQSVVGPNETVENGKVLDGLKH